MLLFAASPAAAGIGEMFLEYSLAYQGPDPVCLLVMPDGSGPGLDTARTIWGQGVDATVSVRILDALYQPIQGYPAEDVWLVAAGGGMMSCAAGSIADAPTDANGETTIGGPLRGGGWSEAPARVEIASYVAQQPAGLALAFNSPDINGDLKVDLSDVQLFAADYYGAYRLRSDFAFDGQVNLSDIVPLAEAMGAVCP